METEVSAGSHVEDHEDWTQPCFMNGEVWGVKRVSRLPSWSKMSKESNKESILKAAYADLNKFGQSGEYEKALKAANRSKLRFIGLNPG